MIGCRLLAHLAQVSGHKITAVSRRIQSSTLSNVTWITKDLSLPQHCDEIVGDQDVIIHLAWNGAPLQSGETVGREIEVGLLPTLEILEAIKRQGRKPHLVFCSSGGTVYGKSISRIPFVETDLCQPIGPYAIQKLAAEHFIATYVSAGYLTATILRVSTVYGQITSKHAMQGFIGIALNRALSGEPVRLIGEISNVRDYVHVEDVVRAIAAAMDFCECLDTINISSGIGTNVMGVLNVIERAIGRSITTVTQTHEKMNMLVDWSVLQNTKALKKLKWMPIVDLASGMTKMLDEIGTLKMFKSN
jgi:UDP-glucose 4-epimerase